MLCSLVGNRCTLGKCPFVFLKRGNWGPECRLNITPGDGARGGIRSDLGSVCCGVFYVGGQLTWTHNAVFRSRPPVRQTKKLVPTLLGDSGEGEDRGRRDQGDNLPYLATLTYLPWKMKFDIKITLTRIYWALIECQVLLLSIATQQSLLLHNNLS